jgi:hypothetical protein
MLPSKLREPITWLYWTAEAEPATRSIFIPKALSFRKLGAAPADIRRSRRSPPDRRYEQELAQAIVGA